MQPQPSIVEPRRFRRRRRRARRLAAGLPAIVVALGALAGGLAPRAAVASVEVKLKVPVAARINLQGRDSVAVAPFLVVSKEGEETSRKRGVDVEAEFERYLKRLIERQTDLKVVEAPNVDFPTSDLEILSRDQDFWRALGERFDADLVVSGSLDFDIQDKSGYRTEEYVSPFDGRTYYRQILVEQTGFEYDIVLDVFDGRTGKLLYSDNFKDFKSFEGKEADPLAGMFQNLRALEDRIAGIFTQKQVETTRLLFTD